MRAKKRRPLDNGNSKGYRESDRDYVDNNMELCVTFLDALTGKAINDKRIMELFFEAAHRIGLEVMEQIARDILKQHANLEEFVMAMGTWTFWKKDGSQLDENTGYLKPLVRFMDYWNDVFKFTGEPMRFTAEGPVIKDW